MDLKTFSEPDFDPKKWINKAWSTSGNQEKEVFVGNTVTRLQLYMKQLTNSLDETTTQIVTSIPRILQDASALQIEGALLQQRLLSLENKVQGVEEQTGHSIDSLQRIDQLKTRLENAASALREADKWAALATSLEDILESGVPTDPAKLRELADQTASMTATLELLVDAPDYEMKRLQLETLYNRLEAAVSPHLIDALSQVDADKTSTYVVLLTHMSRLPSAHRCWRRAAAARLAGAWGRRESHSARALARTLADEANTQLDWLTNVLKSETPVSELMRLYTDLLLSLEPSPTKVVSANMKLCSSPEESILLLTDLKRDLDEFVTCIRGIMESPRQNKETVPPATVLELGRAVYAPLRHLLPQYTALQTQLLLQHLDDDSIKQSDLVECSRALVSLCERSRGWLETAAGNARGVAGGAMAVYYGPAEETFITALSSHISSHFRRIETAFLTTIGSGQTPGVLSHTFPSALLLETAAAVLLDSLTEHLKEPTPPHPLLDLPLLLEAPPRAGAERQACVAALKRSKDQVRGLARAILRHPVDAQLDKIPQLSVWSNNDALSTDLPDFALSPQEYITEIGQYLMTLPQHLELHLSEKQAPWQFLAEVCTHTCDVYAEKILNIRNMDALGTKRCLTDIVYLSSVVEDLGTNVTSSLKNLEKSLRATAPASSE